MKRFLLTFLTVMAAIMPAIAGAPVLAFSESEITLAPGESQEVHLVLQSLDETVYGYQLQFIMYDINHSPISEPVALDYCYGSVYSSNWFNREGISCTDYTTTVGRTNGNGSYYIICTNTETNEAWPLENFYGPDNVLAFTVKADAGWNEEYATLEVDLDYTKFSCPSGIYMMTEPLVLTIRNSNSELPKTETPIVETYTDYGVGSVNITSSEEGYCEIYFRYNKDNNGWSEWLVSDGDFYYEFHEPGYYSIEAYAIAEGKSASGTVSASFVVNPSLTPRPVMWYEISDDNCVVTAYGEGVVKLYKDGVLVDNPCFVQRTYVDQTIHFTATAQIEGCLISETEYMTIIVPAKEVEPGEVYKPVNVTVSSVTNTTADVTWVDEYNSIWNLRYREILPGVNNNLLWDFEEDTNGNTDKTLPGGWTCIDADGDGYEWFHLNDTQDLDYVNHSGIGHVTSASYVHTTDSTGIALTPDNWLVSPKVRIDGELSFWACGQDPNWACEVFRVYTSTDKVNWVPISDDITATGEMTEYTFDLTPYACQNGYVAIRHYNVTDMFRLNVDDVAITYVKPAEWIYVDYLDLPYYTIEDLDPGTNYEVQVQGINNNDVTSDWTESIVFTTSVLLGDVNYDSMINITDLNAMLNIIFFDGDFVIAADMNKDLIINVQDVVGLVHYLLNGEIPSISSNGRRAPKTEAVAQACLYWQDGVLYLNSDVPVSALNIINDVEGDITWNLDQYGMVVMQSTGTQGEHSVIFSFDRSTIPSGLNAIATTNSQHPSVVGAELSNLDSELISVNLNDQLTGLTNIQSDNEFNCHIDGTSLIINSGAALRDIDVSFITIDGRVLANQHLSFLNSGGTSIDMSDILKGNSYLIIVVRNGQQILATQKLTQNK